MRVLGDTVFARRLAMTAWLALALAAGLACAGCAQPGAPAASSEAAGVPAKVRPADPEVKPVSSVSFEDADGAVVMRAASILQNTGDMPCTDRYFGVFAALDADGATMAGESVSGKVALGAGESVAVEARVGLGREQLDAVAGVRFICLFEGDSGFGFFSQDLARPVDEERQAFWDAEAERAEEERIAAWYERFPLDDYSNTTLIGDSIMQNATASLQETLPGVTVNADAGRTLETGGLVFENSSPALGVLDHVRNDDGLFDRYVIGTGNNDPGGMTLADAEEIVACLGEDKEIYFITEATLYDSTSMQVTNAAIADVAERYPNVHVIDWQGMIAGRESEYLSDYCHPYRSREPDYAQCIREGLEVSYPRE